jgi:hypothetical protein
MQRTDNLNGTTGSEEGTVEEPYTDKSDIIVCASGTINMLMDEVARLKHKAGYPLAILLRGTSNADKITVILQDILDQQLLPIMEQYCRNNPKILVEPNYQQLLEALPEAERLTLQAPILSNAQEAWIARRIHELSCADPHLQTPQQINTALYKHNRSLLSRCYHWIKGLCKSKHDYPDRKTKLIICVDRLYTSLPKDFTDHITASMAALDALPSSTHKNAAWKAMTTCVPSQQTLTPGYDKRSDHPDPANANESTPLNVHDLVFVNYH